MNPGPKPCPFCGKEPEVSFGRLWCPDHTQRLNLDDWDDQVAAPPGNKASEASDSAPSGKGSHSHQSVPLPNNPEVLRLLLDVRQVLRDLHGCTDDDCQEQNCMRVYQRCGEFIAQPLPQLSGDKDG